MQASGLPYNPSPTRSGIGGELSALHTTQALRLTGSTLCKPNCMYEILTSLKIGINLAPHLGEAQAGTTCWLAREGSAIQGIYVLYFLMLSSYVIPQSAVALLTSGQDSVCQWRDDGWAVGTACRRSCTSLEPMGVADECYRKPFVSQ